MRSKFLGLLTMCRRAGKIEFGYDASNRAAQAGKIFCIITAADLSARTKKESHFIGDKYSIPVIESGFTMEELARELGRPGGVFGIADKGFAAGFVKIDEDMKSHNGVQI